MLSKRRKILAAILILGSIFTLYSIQILDVRVWNPDIHGPWTLFGEKNYSQIIISWEISNPRYGAIRYDIDATHLDHLLVDTESKSLVHLYLSDLQPNTTYFYQIGYVESPESQLISEFQPLTTTIYQFSTASAIVDQNFKFYAISDTQQIGAGNGYSRKVANYLGNIVHDAAFITVIGDLTENGGEQKYWDDWFDFSSVYLGRTIFVPVPGNHDTNYPRSGVLTDQLFRNYFPISKSNNHFYYSFNYSQVHMIIADFTWPTDSEFSQEQLTWLENDLQSAQAMPFIVVAFHCPIHDSGYFGNDQNMQTRLRPILERYNVTVILNGHDHHYERVEEFGLTYIVLGGGGAIQDPILTPIPETQVIALGPSFAQFATNSTHLNMQIYSLQEELIDAVSFPSRASGGAV